MKWKKRKQLTSWLLVLMLIFNVFLPINTAWANGTDTSNNGTEISSNDGGANETEVTEPSGSTDETEVTEPSGSTDETEVTDPSESTDETEVTDPSESTDETEVTDPSESTDETEVTDPSESTDETEVTDPSESTDETETDDESGIPEETETAAEPEAPSIATDSNALAAGKLNLLPEVFEAEDKTDALMDLEITVMQNGVVIPEDGNLTSTENISINVSFRVPVEGDDFSGVTPPPDIVHKGDTALLELSDAFQLVSGTTVELKDKVKGILLGHVTFTSESGIMYAAITFDGEDQVFDETYNTVKGDFSATLKYDPSGEEGEEGEHFITILGKTFIITVPPVETVYEVKKSGTINAADKSIEWTVDVTAKKGGNPVSLDGYRFSDDLTNVGKYITDSFTVDTEQKTPEEDGNVISYVFPQGSTSPQKLTFKTEISDAIYYSNGKKQIENTAELLDGDTLKADGKGSVTYEPTWITKQGKASDAGSTGAYDPTNRTITWTITANQVGATLNGVVITDKLQDGLSFQSAKWQEWDGTAWGADHPLSDPGTDGKYNIGSINSQILLTIVTKVNSTDVTTGITYYKNSATITWDGLSGSYGANSGNVGVGYAGFRKESTSVDPATGQIGWKVTVDPREQTIPNLKVYDLLVYGSSTSGFDISSVSGIPAGIDTGKLKPQYNQKYVDNTFSGSSGLSITVIPLLQGSDRVADLLEITGFPSGTGTNTSTFEFKSQVLNPEIFASNNTTTIYNTASLFSSNGWMNEATASRSYDSKVLAKEMLKREAMANPAAGVNNRTKDASEGFDYVDKSVIFRLSVNANGMNWGDVMGKATVTDTLPDGWVFDKIGEADYLIFGGTRGSNGSVNATGSALSSVPGLAAGSFIGERTASFTFDPLDKPYVILVKARPTSEKAAGYFNANKTTTERNNLSLVSGSSQTPAATSWQDVSITSQLLEKSLEIPRAGELHWKVDYKPYELSQPGTVLKDTLPTGIDLRTNAGGALILAGGNITAHEMILNANGSYTLGNEVTLVPGENISYDNSARVLSFNIPDSKKAYRFEYITDITGEPGTVSNEVSLYGSDGKQEGTSHPYTITAADGNASMQRTGRIIITKTDSSNSPLSGAEFTLFAADGKTVIKKGVTDSNGTLRFKVIPDGEYILQETAAPAGYNLDKQAFPYGYYLWRRSHFLH
ncbi:MAG: SpaA isopeptide-forming pilin-related protein [Lacrimispora sp.]